MADDAARALTNEGRSAVADYFSVTAGNDNQAKKVECTGANLVVSFGFVDRVLQPLLVKPFPPVAVLEPLRSMPSIR